MLLQKTKTSGNFITIYLKLRSPKGKIEDGMVVIKDEWALATFTDKNLAKQIYDLEKKKGEKVKYNKQARALIKNYKGIKKEEIKDIIKKELDKMGGQIIKEK